MLDKELGIAAAAAYWCWAARWEAASSCPPHWQLSGANKTNYLLACPHSKNYKAHGCCYGCVRRRDAIIFCAPCQPH